MGQQPEDPRDPVLFVTQHYSPEMIGSAPYCTDLAEGLVRRGRPVTVLTGLPHYPDPAEFSVFTDDPPVRQKIAGVMVERLHSWLPKRRSALLRVAGELMFLLSGIGALLRRRVRRHDVVISLCPSIFAVLLGLLATTRGGRHVAMVHDIQSGLAQGLGIVRLSLLVRLMRLAERLILNRVDLILVLSNEMAAALRGIGVASPIEILPIWVDAEAIRPCPIPADQPPTVLYSGNFGRKQGLDQLVALAVALAERRPDVRLLLRGSGGERESVAAAIAARGLGNVRFEDLVPREQLAQALAVGTLHLVPQKPDGADFAVPSKIYNIMAAGRCFVTTALPGSALWSLQAQTEAFLCVPPEDTAALADAVAALLDDPAGRQVMAGRGRAYVERHHTRDALLARIDGWLVALCREGSLPGRPRDLLVLEPDGDGHAEEWLRHLLIHLGGQSEVERIWIAVPEALRQRLSNHLPVHLRHRIGLLALTPTELHYCTHRRLAISGMARWWVMRRYLIRTGAEIGYFLSLDHLSLPLGLGLSAGTRRLSGILFRPSVHYHTIGDYRPGLGERLRDRRKAALYRGMLRNRAVDTVLTLDPFFAEFAAEHYPGGEKVGVVPDPAFPAAAIPANDDRLPMNVPQDRHMLLLFGALTERKGVLHLLDALQLLPLGIAGKIAVVIAGKVAPDIQREVDIKAGRLRRERPDLWLLVENRWLGSPEIAALVQRCDVVLAPYQRFVGSSGVLLWAARAGKPLLTQDYGLLGRLVRDHALGLAVDTTDPRALADGIARMIKQGPHSLMNVTTAADFVAQRTPETFANRVFASLRQS
ncbi:MAG: glycosyltransferase [Ferrovibrio sp.]|uniref:glycosyltransferase n=1 Tax=Ferrovibrio sp. TaxID=1917215 RepID=UPI0026396569|nr:glycosyltransferase [Ferrovibrio sp.]MCW0235869.1 glycosyltransferase [Ferrovibrio sp.]